MLLCLCTNYLSIDKMSADHTQWVGYCMLETLMNGYFRNAVRFIVHVICHTVIFYYIEKDRPFILFIH